MVLIHGVAGAWRAWHGVAPLLAERFDVLAVALAGHEDAAPLPSGVPLTVASMTDAVERDMDAAGFGAAHLVGNSLGGWIALELAKRGRARTVVALSPAGGWTPRWPPGRSAHSPPPTSRSSWRASTDLAECATWTGSPAPC